MTRADEKQLRVALERAAELYAAAGALDRDSSDTLARLRTALGGTGERRAALILLSVLDPRYTVELTDVLTACALSARDAMLVRQLFGRLPRHQVQSVVPAAVWRQLEQTPDEDAYRRLAELLYYLGLDDALRELSSAALASDDPEIRQVGEEFSPD
jgi:hypothetical protein